MFFRNSYIILSFTQYLNKMTNIFILENEDIFLPEKCTPVTKEIL